MSNFHYDRFSAMSSAMVMFYGKDMINELSVSQDEKQILYLKCFIIHSTGHGFKLCLGEKHLECYFSDYDRKFKKQIYDAKVAFKKDDYRSIHNKIINDKILNLKAQLI